MAAKEAIDGGGGGRWVRGRFGARGWDTAVWEEQVLP